jgi:hypothetical protein
MVNFIFNIHLKYLFSVVKLPISKENDDINLSTNLKPKSSLFQGIISQCFEDHLDIYIAELDR